jgi:uncharacterized membrane protein YfcA
LTSGLEAALVLAGAFAAGAVNSTVGGGGLIQLPALMAAYPQASPATLLGTNKLASLVGTASAVLRYSRHLEIAWRVVLPAAAVAFLASLGGAATVRLLPPDLFRPLVPVLLALLLAYVAWHRDLGTTHAPRRIGAGMVALGGVLFAALGFFDGFFGPGVGSFLLLVFVRLYGYDYLHAAASARVINLSSNAAAVIYFGTFGHVSWALGAAMAVSNVLGAQAGTAFALRHGSRLIRSAFILVVCILIVKTGRDAWLGG